MSSEWMNSLLRIYTAMANHYWERLANTPLSHLATFAHSYHVVEVQPYIEDTRVWTILCLL